MKCVPAPGEANKWQLSFNHYEAAVFAGSSQQLAAQYRLNMEELPETLQDYWRGRIGAGRDIDSLPEEQRHLEEERLTWRSERLILVEKWFAAYLESGIGQPWALELDREELESFLIIINDRKQTLNRVHELDEELIEADLEDIADETLRQVLFEIYVLDQIEAACLAAIQSESNPGTSGEGDAI